METTSDAMGGFNVGNVDNNDWMSYPVSVLRPRAGTRCSSGWPARTRAASSALSRNSADLVTVAVPNTGGWQNWQTVTASVYLSAGQQDLTIFAKVGGWNINWWQLNPQ
ncbi:carbohydrate-binding protein [Massilia sp. H-1]|nr:carbohydrate-binding protein [Massilia sp. H-1]